VCGARTLGLPVDGFAFAADNTAVFTNSSGEVRCYGTSAGFLLRDAGGHRRISVVEDFGCSSQLAAQQVPAACVPPEFGDPPIIRPIDRVTTGGDLDGEPSASDPAEAAKQSAQNVMKNEFCAWRDTEPALVTRFPLTSCRNAFPRFSLGLSFQDADCGGAQSDPGVLHHV
jgi:hypothetical protein